MVPLGTLASIKPSSGPDVVFRYNRYRAIQILGAPAPGAACRLPEGELELRLEVAFGGQLERHGGNLWPPTRSQGRAPPEPGEPQEGAALKCKSLRSRSGGLATSGNRPFHAHRDSQMRQPGSAEERGLYSRAPVRSKGGRFNCRSLRTVRLLAPQSSEVGSGLSSR